MGGGRLPKIVDRRLTKASYDNDGVLSKSPLFEGISGDQLELLLNCLKPKIETYKRNDLIAIAGNKFDSLGILLQGEATINKENALGNRVMIAMLEPGDMFGEVLIFSGETCWPSTIQAQKACKVLYLSSERIIGECKNVCPWHHMLIENMLKIISQKALILNKKVEYLTIGGVREKVSAFLLEQYKRFGKPAFTLPMNRNEMAEFLNVSRPSLSREMCRMRNKGIIDFHMSEVKIIDIERLKQCAE
jgi:CRP-like cAMP-binding protein